MRIKFNVKEVIYHKGSVEVSEETVERLKRAGDDDALLSEILADYTGQHTEHDGEYEDGEYSISN